METNQVNEQEAVNQIYQYAANLMISQKMNSEETKQALVAKGMSAENAAIVVDNLEAQITTAKKDRAKKDMLYGALWCVGGIVATAAHIGFIFWGAIVFGGIQFFKGLFSL